MRFLCPTCKNQKLSVATHLTVINEDGDHEYGEQTNEDGRVSQYQCMHCGYLVCNEGGPITDAAELGAWVKENCSQTDEEYETFATVVFSTGHVTAEDYKLFRTGAHEGLLINHEEFGYMLYVWTEDDDTFETLVAALKAAGFSEHVIKAVKIGKTIGAKWVLWDCDGTVYNHLPYFEW